MKFVKSISLFFIYPITMFGIGFAANMAIQEYFYPGDAQIQKTAPAQPEMTAKEVAVTQDPVITANTEYTVMCYDAVSGKTKETQEVTPDKYIGLTREKLEEELKEYGKSPSLKDLEKGFSFIELLSFSPDKVVIRKSYEKKEEEAGFFLLNENHYVVVYDKSLAYVYMNTDILTDELPQELQNEIMHMKFVETEDELYNFLESYSS